jgi:hypothetical protein
MKKLLATACVAAVMAIQSFGQGTILGSNAGATFSSPVFDIDGTTPLSGATFLAQVYGGADAGSLTALGAPVAFLTGASEGYFFSGTLTVPGVVGGGVATIVVRAWNAAGGATYEQASATIGARAGESNIFTVTTGNPAGSPPTSPAALAGMESFNLVTVVPEPSIIALGLVGCGLFMLRRKK